MDMYEQGYERYWLHALHGDWSGVGGGFISTFQIMRALAQEFVISDVLALTSLGCLGLLLYVATWAELFRSSISKKRRHRLT